MAHPHADTYSHSTLDEFRVGFDYQTEWIQGRGLLLLAAIWVGGVGAGLFLTSLLIGWPAGLIPALLIVAIAKGGFHLGFLGRPERFWRAFLKPQVSWLSRGIYFLVLFLIFGALYVYQPVTLWMVLSALFAILLAVYTGFLMAASPAIRFWNNPLLPILFLAVALGSGASLAELLQGSQAASRPEMLQPFQLVVVAIAAFLLLTYMVVNHTSTIAAKEAVAFLALGSMAPIFYGLVVVLGIIIPVAILAMALLGEMPATLLAVAGLSELVGSLFLRYCILRAGVYSPVL